MSFTTFNYQPSMTQTALYALAKLSPRFCDTNNKMEMQKQDTEYMKQCIKAGNTWCIYIPSGRTTITV